MVQKSGQVFLRTRENVPLVISGSWKAYVRRSAFGPQARTVHALHDQLPAGLVEFDFSSLHEVVSSAGMPGRGAKYTFLKRLSTGRIAEVFIARQSGLAEIGRIVIVKRLRDDFLRDSPISGLFVDEARVAACLNHPNIVQLYDVDTAEGVPFIVMEYVFGASLSQTLARCRQKGIQVPIANIVKIMADVLGALHYAFCAAEYRSKPLRLIHRDVSPQNILISFDGGVKLADFGVAKAETQMQVTQAGMIKGKYAYMSPEQVHGKPLDQRTDLFSAGIVLYEAVTGTQLFNRDGPFETMKAVDQCEVPAPRKLRKDIPWRLRRIIRKSLRKTRWLRYQTALDMQRALEKLYRRRIASQQTEELAAFMRDVFAEELAARKTYLEAAAGERHELILRSGFELISTLDLRAMPVPPAPLAQDALRRAHGKPLSEGLPTVLTVMAGKAMPDATEITVVTKRPGKAASFKWIVVVFIITMSLMLLALVLLR